MTPDDYRLDPVLFYLQTPLPLYRLARSKYANLSGVGASSYPGRWNRLGQEAIYTSTEKSVPVLERLVHTPKNLIPVDLSLMCLAFAGTWTLHTSGEKVRMVDGSTGSSIRFFHTLRAARAAFDTSDFFEGNPLAVALPSVIVPVWNVVLYPAGIAFWKHVELRSLSPFAFDPRLFPEGTSSEAELAS